MTYSVVFVCTGNVCRSPAAERLLRHHLAGLSMEGVEVASAGTAALAGEPVSAPMAELIRSARADPSGFVARQLTPSQLRQADLVVAMTSAHRTAAVRMAPASVQYAYTLAQLGAMLSHVDPPEVTERAQSRDAGARLAAAVSLGRQHRALGVDPADDIVDPYGRPAAVYAKSFQQIVDGLAPVVRALATSS